MRGVWENNFVLDFIIENVNIVDKPDTLLLSPLFSCNIPTTDYFINSYFNKDDIDKIHKAFLKVDIGFVSKYWKYDYSHLNEFTLKSTKWDFEKFLDASNNINYHFTLRSNNTMFIFIIKMNMIIKKPTYI